MKSLFSPILIQAITDSLANQEQVILFQNRRGYAPYLECRQCGYVPNCPNCSVSLTYHRNVNQLFGKFNLSSQCKSANVPLLRLQHTATAKLQCLQQRRYGGQRFWNGKN